MVGPAPPAPGGEAPPAPPIPPIMSAMPGKGGKVQLGANTEVSFTQQTISFILPIS